MVAGKELRRTVRHATTGLLLVAVFSPLLGPRSTASAGERAGLERWRLAMDVGAPSSHPVDGRCVSVPLPDGIRGVELGGLIDVRSAGSERVDAIVLSGCRGRQLVFRAPGNGRYVGRFDGVPAPAGAADGGKAEGKTGADDWPRELTLAVRGLQSGHPPATPEEASRAARFARPLYGEDAAEEARLREHPFRLNGRYVARFSGSLRVAQGGSWRFRAQSFGPSFLFVDGRELLADPRGRRRSWSLRIEQSEASCSLSPGFHRVECLYFNISGPPYLDLLACPPGGDTFGPIPRTMWASYEQPQALSLSDADGRPVLFLLAQPAQPSLSLDGDVRTRVTLKPCGTGGREATYEVSLDGGPLGVGQGPFTVWLGEGTHVASVRAKGPDSTTAHAVQKIDVHSSQQVEPLEVRFDLGSLPSFLYSGARLRLHVPILTGNSIGVTAECAIDEHEAGQWQTLGTEAVEPERRGEVPWPVSVPQEGEGPKRAALSLRVWGREVAKERLVILPLGSPQQLGLTAVDGGLRGPDGEIVVLAKGWQSRETEQTWPLVKWAWRRVRTPPAPRSVIVVGLPGDDAEWEGIRPALDEAFRPHNSACEMLSSQPAPWPCLYDVAALRRRLHSSAPDAVVLSPGWWDAVVGTPMETFTRAVDFALAMARQKSGRVVVLLPGICREQDPRRPYVEAAQEVAHRHKVPCTMAWETPAGAPAEASMGDVEWRWPLPAAQRKVAERLVELVFKR